MSCRIHGKSAPKQEIPRAEFARLCEVRFCLFPRVSLKLLPKNHVVNRNVKSQLLRGVNMRKKRKKERKMKHLK